MDRKIAITITLTAVLLLAGAENAFAADLPAEVYRGGSGDGFDLADGTLNYSVYNFVGKSPNNNYFISCDWEGQSTAAASARNIILQVARFNKMDETVDKTFTGEVGSYFGASVATADINNDSYVDIVVGALVYNSNQGRVYLYYGGTDMNESADKTFTGEAGSSRFGYSLATADVNQDNYPDIVVSAREYNSNQGRVYLYYGGTDMNESADKTFTGESSSYFGWSVATGDIDQDNYPDIVVGAYYYNSYQGRVYLYYGGTDMNESADKTFTGEVLSNFGWSVATADINQDNYPDIVVGAYRYNNDDRGRVYLYYGGTDMNESADKTFTGELTSRFGYSVATGDVNQDNYPDIVVGANWYNFWQGRAYLYYGGTDMNESVDKTFTGEAGSRFGISVATGDINNDSYVDIVVGADRYNTFRGRVYLYYGGTDMNEAVDKTFTGESSSNFGSSVATGDVNQDNYPDIVVGAYYYNSYQGRAYLFYAPPLTWETIETTNSLDANTDGWVTGLVTTNQSDYYDLNNWSYWRVYQEGGSLKTDTVEFNFVATLVKLVSFKTLGLDRKVDIVWKTASEYHNAGFNLYKSISKDGPYQRLNSSIIGGLGNSLQGKEYSYTDNDVDNGTIYYYKLEDIDFEGTKTLHGPVEAHPGLDSDSDGMTDDWEDYYGLDKTSDDSQEDPDNDGLTNLEEFSQGTDPLVSEGSGGGGGSEPEIPQGLKILSSDATGITLELTTSSFTSSTKSIEGEDFDVLEISGYTHGFTVEAGKPFLPSKGVLLGIPFNCSLSISILESEQEQLQGYNIPPVSDYSFITDYLYLEGYTLTETVSLDDYYQQSSFYPQGLAQASFVGEVRGQRLASINIYPFSFKPSTKDLRFYKRIKLKVEFIPEEEEPPEPPEEASLPENTIKIYVSQDGIHRLTYQDLWNAGLEEIGWLDPRTLSLYHQGEQISMRVEGEGDGVFNYRDSIEFYGRGNSGKYSSDNVYYITYGEDSPLRLQDLASSPEAADFTAQDFLHTEHLETNNFWWSERAGSDDIDRWFWYSIIRPGSPQVYDINVENLNSLSSRDAQLKIAYYGLRDVPHKTLSYLNDQLIDETLWEGADENIVEKTLSLDILIEGINTIKIDTQYRAGQDYEYLVPNYFRLQYPKKFAAKDNFLEFSYQSPGEGIVEFIIQEFTEPEIAVYDVTEIYNVKRIVGFDIQAQGEYFTLTFKDNFSTGEEKHYILLSSDNIKSAEALKYDTPSQLKSTSNQADYIIITPYGLRDALLPLEEFYEEKDFKVEVVDIEDIYDEFNFGAESPYAIREFLKYAYNYWATPKPLYVLIVGDATYDYKNYLQLGKPNSILYLLPNTPFFGETGSDNWFVCLDGEDDILPDMFIGRIPARTYQELDIVVEKIINYQNQEYQDFYKNVIIIADSQYTPARPSYFKEIAEELAESLPSYLNIKKIYLGESSYSSEDVLREIEKGALLVIYIGHGSVDLWSDQVILDTDSIKLLNNENKLPFIVSFGCVDGYYFDPYKDWRSMAETFLFQKYGGGIASFSPTGMGIPPGHRLLGQGLLSAIFSEDAYTLGEAITQAKIKLFTNSGGSFKDLIQTYHLFSDPALELKREPQEEEEIEAPPLIKLPPSVSLPKEARKGGGLKEGFERVLKGALDNYEKAKEWRDETKTNIEDITLPPQDTLLLEYLSPRPKYRRILGKEEGGKRIKMKKIKGIKASSESEALAALSQNVSSQDKQPLSFKETKPPQEQKNLFQKVVHKIATAVKSFFQKVADSTKSLFQRMLSALKNLFTPIEI